MKKIIHIILIFSLIYFTLSLIPKMYIAAEDDLVGDLSHEDNLIDIIFKLLYKEKEEEAKFNPDKLKYLLGRLEIFEKKHPDEKRSVLFVRAESYYRLNEYKEAYIAFYRLKMLIKNKNDPLYTAVERRLNDLLKKVKPLNKPKTLNYNNWLLPYNIGGGFILFGFIVFIYDRTKRKKDGSEKKDHDKDSSEEKGYDIEIVPKYKLITIEDMRKQDGRCSENAISIYKKGIADGSWETFGKRRKEMLKSAELLVKGHKMIEEMNKLTPYPIKMISKIPILRTLSYFWQYTFFGFGFSILWYLVSWKTEWSTVKSPVTFFLLAAFVISCLTGIRIMAAKTIDALDELVSMLEPDSEEDTFESISDLKIWIDRLLRSPRQYYFFVVVMILIVWSLYNSSLLILDNGYPNLDLIFSTYLVLIASSLIWFMTGSIVLMNKIYNLKDLSMNPLSPYKTMGLEKLISLVGTYNIVCSVVLSFGCSIAVYKAYLDGQNILYGSFWFFFITPMLIFYWIYPYLKIGSLVKSIKIKRMNFVKTKISLLFNDWIKSEDVILQNYEKQIESGKENPEMITKMEEDKKKIFEKLEDMEKYYNVFKKIEESPESYFDLNSALELAKVMGFPTLFAIISALLSFYL